MMNRSLEQVARQKWRLSQHDAEQESQHNNGPSVTHMAAIASSSSPWPNNKRITVTTNKTMKRIKTTNNNAIDGMTLIGVLLHGSHFTPSANAQPRKAALQIEATKLIHNWLATSKTLSELFWSIPTVTVLQKWWTRFTHLLTCCANPCAKECGFGIHQTFLNSRMPAVIGQQH